MFRPAVVIRYGTLFCLSSVSANGVKELGGTSKSQPGVCCNVLLVPVFNLENALALNSSSSFLNLSTTANLRCIFSTRACASSNSSGFKDCSTNSDKAISFSLNASALIGMYGATSAAKLSK